MGKPMTSASHVATGATGATNVVVDTVGGGQAGARSYGAYKLSRPTNGSQPSTSLAYSGK